jgi:hypothetical protein
MIKKRMNNIIIFVSLIQAILAVVYAYNGIYGPDKSDFTGAVIMGVCSFLTFRYGGLK